MEESKTTGTGVADGTDRRFETVVRRRGFLALSSVLAFSTTGCFDALGDASTDVDDGDDGGSEGASDADGTDAYILDVRVEHPTYVITTTKALSTEVSKSVRVDDIVEPARGYVRTAVDEGRAPVEEPDDVLHEAVEGIRDGDEAYPLEGVNYVRDGDDVYVLEHSLPVYVVTGEDVGEEEVDSDRTVSMTDDVIRALGVDNRQVAFAANTVVDRGEGYSGEDYETTVLSPGLEEFVEDYDYISHSSGYVEIELKERDPDEYYISAEKVTHEELFDVEEVRELGTLPKAVAEVVRAAVEGGYRSDTVPKGFEEEAGDAYFLVNGQAHRPELHEPDYDDAPVELGVEVIDDEVGKVNDPPDEDTLEEHRERFEGAYEDAQEEEVGSEKPDEDVTKEPTDELWNVYRPDDGAIFDLSITNTSDETVVVRSGAPAPFGVLMAEEEGTEKNNRRERRLLWSETYVENRHVTVSPEGFGVNAIGVSTEFEPGKTETETYEVGFELGEYRVEETVSVSRDRRGDGETYPYTLVVEVDDASSDDEA